MGVAQAVDVFKNVSNPLCVDERGATVNVAGPPVGGDRERPRAAAAGLGRSSAGPLEQGPGRLRWPARRDPRPDWHMHAALPRSRPAVASVAALNSRYDVKWGAGWKLDGRSARGLCGAVGTSPLARCPAPGSQRIP